MSSRNPHAVQWPKSGVWAVAQAARSSTRDLYRGQQQCLANMADNCISAINSTKIWCCHGNVKKSRALRFLQCQHRRALTSFNDVSGAANSCSYDASDCYQGRFHQDHSRGERLGKTYDEQPQEKSSPFDRTLW